MQSYLDLGQNILEKGKWRSSPQGIKKLSVFARQMHFDLAEGFPLITTKSLKSSWRGIIAELLWFLQGRTDVSFLHEHGAHFWDQWADERTCTKKGLPIGELGPIYGKQWRAFEGGGNKPVDQIAELIKRLKTNPDSARHIVTAWNPVDVEKVFVAPCHCFYQLYHEDGELSLQLYQRSADIPVGVPFNIAEYSLLLMMIAQVTGLKAREFIHTTGDTHIYADQVEGFSEQLPRTPRQLPTVTINPDIKDIFSFTHDDFLLEGYDPHPYIKIPCAY